MSINYLEGVEVGAKINLDRLKDRKSDRPVSWERFLPFLKNGLKTAAVEMNRQYGDFLNPDLKISLNGPDAASDEELVKQQELAFAGHQSLEEYRRQRAGQQSEIAEMALALMFQKLLGEDFLVVRASTYDDNNNGFDLLIVDKASGAVVCGVDEVLTHYADVSSPKKEEKLFRKMQSGGATVKYGVTFSAGRLVRQSLKNVPAFYAAVHPGELTKIISSLELEQKESTSAEQAVLERVIVSLEEQYTALDTDGLQPRLKENLEKFAASLEKIKKNHFPRN